MPWRASFFLTSQETLVVFEPGHQADGAMTMQCREYPFEGHHMTDPGGAEVIAGRYLIKSVSGRLLMVKRFASADPARGTVCFQLFTLQWANGMQYWHRSYSVLSGQLLFIWRGCSRVLRTGQYYPGFIYYLDDTEGFRDVQTVLQTEKQYRCSDTGRFCYFSRKIHKR